MLFRVVLRGVQQAGYLSAIRKVAPLRLGASPAGREPVFPGEKEVLEAGVALGAIVFYLQA